MGPHRTLNGRLLAAILALAALARVWGVWFGLPDVQARPDEDAVVGVAFGFVEGKWWPGLFDYPRLLMYLLAAVYGAFYAVGRIAGAFDSFAEFVSYWHRSWWVFFLIGRLVSVAAGVASVAVLYKLASRIGTTRLALVSAFLLATAFLHVRDSHYATTDVMTTLLALGSVLWALRLAETGRARDANVGALLAGLTTATKYNAALLALPLGIAGARRMRECADAGIATRVRASRWVPMALVMTGVFLVVSPYILFDYERFKFARDVLGQSYQSGMKTGLAPEPGWLHHLRVSLWHGVGGPTLLLAPVGLVAVSRRKPWAALVILAFPLGYFAVAGAGRLLFVRYMVPVVPFVCLFAAAGIEALAARLKARPWLPAGAVAALLAAVTAAPSIIKVVRFDELLARADSRAIVADWVRAHVPRGRRIAQSGSEYGRVDFGFDAGYDLWEYAEEIGRFLDRRRYVVDGLPDVVIVQQSPLPYSYVLPGMARLLAREYRLVHRVRAVDPRATGNVYDLHDAFFLPYAGFHGILRPGPTLYIWERAAIIDSYP
jgi:hypothetical protein